MKAKINSRQKGARGERELARRFREQGYDCRRGQQYNGLDQARQPDKAKALELALGYTQKNHRELMENIQRNLSHFPAVYKGTDGYGDRYEIEMMLVGANGRVARLMTGWIIDKEKRETRLTSVYINKRKKG